MSERVTVRVHAESTIVNQERGERSARGEWDYFYAISAEHVRSSNGVSREIAGDDVSELSSLP